MICKNLCIQGTALRLISALISICPHVQRMKDATNGEDGPWGAAWAQNGADRCRNCRQKMYSTAMSYCDEQSTTCMSRQATAVGVTCVSNKHSRFCVCEGHFPAVCCSNCGDHNCRLLVGNVDLQNHSHGLDLGFSVYDRTEL